MQVDYVNHMGDDLMVVNAARVSFHKESEWEEGEYINGQEVSSTNILKEGDRKLIRYLATNGHWTPFSHPQISLRIKAPIFVARQLYKHKVGFTENEISRRYVDDEPEFYVPEVWRGRPTNGAKQGSSDDTVDTIIFHGIEETWEDDVDILVHNAIATCANLYDDMIKGGVAPEQARMILPQAMYTEWYWTSSLAGFARMCKLRLDPHAQAETREIAQQIDAIIRPLFPIAWSALVDPKE